MKKLLFIFLAAATLMSFTGCRDNVVGDVVDDITGNTVTTAPSNDEAIVDDDIIIDDDIIASDSDGIIADGQRSNRRNADRHDNNTTDRTNDGKTSKKILSYGEGELKKLASLVGCGDVEVVNTLGTGKKDMVIDGNTVLLSSRKYNYMINGAKENLLVYYKKGTVVNKITLSPKAKGTALWRSLLITEFGRPDKISENGLSYQYLSQWRDGKTTITLMLWNDRLSVTFR